MSTKSSDYYIHEPERLKDLLRMYPQLKALLLNTQEELKRIIAEGENFIGGDALILEALELGNRELSDMPFSPSKPAPGRKETEIIVTYKDRKYSMVHDTQQELAQEIIKLREVVRKIEHAYACLSRDQKIIIEKKYCEALEWEEVASKIHLTKRKAQNLHGVALQRMIPVLRITRQSYEWCCKRLDADNWRTQERKVK